MGASVSFPDRAVRDPSARHFGEGDSSLGKRAAEDSFWIALSSPTQKIVNLLEQAALARTGGGVAGGAVRVGGSAFFVTFWTTATMVVADWGVNAYVGEYDSFVLARLKEKLQKQGRYDPGIWSHVENFIMPSLHNLKVSAGYYTNATDSQLVTAIVEIFNEDRVFVQQLQENLLAFLGELLDFSPTEDVVALLVKPVTWGFIEPARERCKTSLNAPESKEYYGPCALISEKEVAQFISNYMQTNNILTSTDRRVYEQTAQLYGVSEEQYAAIVEKSAQAKLQQLFALGFMLNPDGFAGRESTPGEQNLFRQMFTAEGTLKPDQVQPFVNWARRTTEDRWLAQKSRQDWMASYQLPYSRTLPPPASLFSRIQIGFVNSSKPDPAACL